MIRRFANLTNEGNEESKIYLEENEWDLEKAYTAWKVDEKWEGQFYLSKVQEAINSNKTVVPAAVEVSQDAFEERAIEMLCFSEADEPLMS